MFKNKNNENISTTEFNGMILYFNRNASFQALTKTVTVTFNLRNCNFNKCQLF